MAMVRLRSAGNQQEALLMKGLLQAQGIPCVIHGESQGTSMGTEAGYAEILLLVPEESLPDAEALLSSQVVGDAPEPGSALAEGALCPVHERQATGACSRCGSFVCATCGALGEPPVCEACAMRAEDAPRSRAGTKLVAWLLLGVFLGLPAVWIFVERLARWLGL